MRVDAGGNRIVSIKAMRKMETCNMKRIEMVRNKVKDLETMASFAFPSLQ